MNSTWRKKLLLRTRTSLGNTLFLLARSEQKAKKDRSNTGGLNNDHGSVIAKQMIQYLHVASTALALMRKISCLKAFLLSGTIPLSARDTLTGRMPVLASGECITIHVVCFVVVC